MSALTIVKCATDTCYHPPMKLFGILLSMFIVIPVLEFALLIEIGSQLGTLPTLALIFGTGIVGAYLARLEGIRIIHRVQQEFQRGAMPADQLFDGLLVLIAGVVLLTPGLLTDIAGLILLIPITRYPVKMFIRSRAQSWIKSRHVQISM